MKRIIFLLCIVFLVAGCASKRYTKKGKKFEEAGLYEDAANNYYEAVYRKSSNVDAKLGLHKTGQITLDHKLTEFMNSYKQGNYDKAVYEYLDSEKYYKKLKKVGVKLSFPENYKAYYEEAKSDYLGQKYIEGLEKLNREEFSAALSVFSEIKSIDENYKDIKEKYIIAKYEPKYREGIQYLESAYYRKAYYEFERIQNGAGDYKQVFSLKEEAREKATISILIIDFKASSRYTTDAAASITTKLKGAVGNLDNPFIQLIDEASIESSIYNNGEIDMQVANLSGIDVVLSGRLMVYNKKTGKLIETPQRGYLKEVYKVRNEAGEETEKVTYHKTNYSEFKAKNSASVKLNYKMVSTKNSEVLMSDDLSRQKTDAIHYAMFDGDKKKLIPGYWKYKKGNSDEDVIEDNKSDVRALKRLLDADRKIQSANSLMGQLLTKTVKELSSKVDKYNPEDE